MSTMVSALRVDALRDPTAALQELYESASGSENFPRRVSEHFKKVFEARDAFNEIPTLDIQHPPHVFPARSIVRFRAMVQDTSASSEMYLTRFPSGKCGGWGIDSEDVDASAGVDYSHLRECRIVWAVSVPGETAWCREELDGPEDQQERPAPPLDVHRYRSTHAHKGPLPVVPHIGVQLKIYDVQGGDSLKATDVYTFVGILTSDPYSADFDNEAQEVPTLHVLFSRQQPASYLARPYPFAVSQPDAVATAGDAPDRPLLAQTRSDLITWVAREALGGDLEAAEWVLLSVIARVQSRTPPLFPPSLTISRFPSQPPTPSAASPSALLPALSSVLAQLLPLFHTLPLSLPFLNGASFTPESKQEDLHSGVLQLPQGSVLLVSEGGVQEGKLVEKGLLNVHALQEVMSTQTLSYVFPFSSFSFPTDISTVILAEGAKSAFFKTDLTVPLHTPHDRIAASQLYKPADSIHRPSDGRLEAFRDLILGSGAGKVVVSEDTSEHIQRDFVEERKRDKSITSDDLIRRMTVAKLYTLSCHQTELTADVWEKAKALDQRRLARLTH